MEIKKAKRDRRTAKIQITCTPNEKANLEAQAFKQEMTLAEYIRNALRGIIRPPQMKAG